MVPTLGIVQALTSTSYFILVLTRHAGYSNMPEILGIQCGMRPITLDWLIIALASTESIELNRAS